jgi:hypothetical protein
VTIKQKIVAKNPPTFGGRAMFIRCTTLAQDAQGHANAEGELMSSSNLVRLGGGLTSVAAGILLLVGHLLNLGGDPEYGTVVGSLAVLTAHVLLVFALVALYAVQAERIGLLGTLGMFLSVVGTTLASGVILVEIAGASGAQIGTVLEAGVTGVLALLAGLTFLIIGLILLGGATTRAGVLPYGAGLLLIAGDVVFGASSFAGAASLAFEVIGALITCAAFVWLGLALLSGRRSSAPAGQPAHVS